MTRCILLMMIFCAMFSCIHAQNLRPSFTAKQLKDFDNEIIGDVSNFCYYLQDLASSNTKEQDKPQLKKNLLGLFVSTAKIQVTSVSKPQRKHDYPLREYLDLVGGYSSKYKFVAIEFTQVVVDVNNLRDTTINGEKLYVGNYSFLQVFLASKTDKETNKYTKEELKQGGSDKTKKKGVYYIIPDDSKGDKSWIILLGDIKAEETKSV